MGVLPQGFLHRVVVAVQSIVKFWAAGFAQYYGQDSLNSTFLNFGWVPLSQSYFLLFVFTSESQSASVPPSLPLPLLSPSPYSFCSTASNRALRSFFWYSASATAPPVAGLLVLFFLLSLPGHCGLVCWGSVGGAGRASWRISGGLGVSGAGGRGGVLYWLVSIVRWLIRLL